MPSSRIVVLNLAGKFIRTWDMSEVRTFHDARSINVSDTIEYGSIRFTITYIGEDPRDGNIVWCGKIFGALEEYGLSDDSVIAWGPRGMANTFPQYKEGNYIKRVKPDIVTSYLWT